MASYALCYVLLCSRPSRYVPLFGFRKYSPENESVWQPEVTIEEQVSAMGELIKEGKIKYWGVSNETTYGEGKQQSRQIERWYFSSSSSRYCHIVVWHSREPSGLYLTLSGRQLALK